MIRLEDYRNIVILTGSGISQASGLPTYRGPEGLWSDPAQARLSYKDALENERAACLAFFAGLRQAAARAEPNAAHRHLACLQSRRNCGFLLVTLNLDGLHQKAGSRDVVELHGSAFRSRCLDPACGKSSEAEATEPCPACGAAMRPDIVLFGEYLDLLLEHRCARALRDCDLFICIGASGTVYPAAGFARSAVYAGARTVFINREGTNDPAYREQYLGDAEALVPELLA
jgi:NAD-dependent deacetylase